MLLYFPLHFIYIMGDNVFYLGLNIMISKVLFPRISYSFLDPM